ncbi:flap endonuclease-1 [Methanolobus chelungpuianus]|uniref:Flap endonuclease 1 n=1 Tax=Methanolobus chelungpuianus TaxID=502115 RepID=A0AAE3KWW5_9EURY|nr:flap endonuclease-1 [Methanolobus chelungpuianus]MCQ6961699.1 flap endonuclease-1 [Methanolobus chelungpuianus]
MGVDLGDLLKKKPVELSDLSSKVIAIDAYNTLYQFLSIIRQRDGTPLKDSKGNVTSHLSGLLYRMSSLMEAGIKPVFVFDGKPPEMKSSTIEKRVEARENAKIKWTQAQEAGLAEEAYKYAQASSRVDATIVEDSRKLLDAMGIPFVDAPSEGEAQAAYMVSRGDADYTGSQDYDSLLFGAPRVVRNLTVSGKRKVPRKNLYVDVKPEIMQLEETLNGLGISREQLIDIALCVGTDYNPGLANIGPKKALKLVKEHGGIKEVLARTGNEIPGLADIKEFFMNPPVTKDYALRWKKPKTDSVLQLLCDEHDFSRERVTKALEKLEASSGAGQRTLDSWF